MRRPFFSAPASYQKGRGLDETPLDIERVQRIVITIDRLTIALSDSAEDTPTREINISWYREPANRAAVMGRENAHEGTRHESLIRAIARAHAWLQQLVDESYASVEDLADANSIHPKVVRQALRPAYLSPQISATVLNGNFRAIAHTGADPEAAAASMGDATAFADVEYLADVK